ncbi:hypothetical protein [Burkholderia cenocepacia]|uniref:hypothetical protein n=1 Tax=Burkholderia cenocepacia TaxID=95486 RepID=UPI00076C5BD8|nr:hypothetical protein [Burkholderia cenocepacia]KWU19023.1 hypothetical protein AS149_12300 [Burkholderia cenocepacia]
MDYPQLMIYQLTAEGTTREARESRKPGLTILAFHQMAFWVLSQFAQHDGLKSLMLTTVYKADSYVDEQLLEVKHHVKFAADGADLGLSEPGAQENLAHEIAPTEYLGNGTITVLRDDEVVKSFISAVATEKKELVDGTVHQLASRLVPALGKLLIQHQLNSFV